MATHQHARSALIALAIRDLIRAEIALNAVKPQSGDYLVASYAADDAEDHLAAALGAVTDKSES